MGLATNVKKRFLKHWTTMNNRGADGQPTLSRYVWNAKDEAKNPEITWKFLEKNGLDFNHVTSSIN